MKKRDFIQHASAQFMPDVNWDVDKSIRYAEKLWLKLNEKGYGDSKPPEMKPVNDVYKTLKPNVKTAFDKFWSAFNHKHNKQRAAQRWQEMGELSPDAYSKIIKAAAQTAQARKSLPEGQVPKMAEGWLSERRYDDFAETATEKNSKQEGQKAQQIREVTGDLNHAKKMASDTQDEFWPKEVERLTKKLKQQR